MTSRVTLGAVPALPVDTTPAVFPVLLLALRLATGRVMAVVLARAPVVVTSVVI